MGDVDNIREALTLSRMALRESGFQDLDDALLGLAPVSTLRILQSGPSKDPGPDVAGQLYQFLRWYLLRSIASLEVLSFDVWQQVAGALSKSLERPIEQVVWKPGFGNEIPVEELAQVASHARRLLASILAMLDDEEPHAHSQSLVEPQTPQDPGAAAREARHRSETGHAGSVGARAATFFRSEGG